MARIKYHEGAGLEVKCERPPAADEWKNYSNPSSIAPSMPSFNEDDLARIITAKSAVRQEIRRIY